MSDYAGQIEHLTVELLTSLSAWRTAKQVYADRTAIYYRRHPDDQVTADFQAQSDYLRQMSVVDADWHQREIQTTSLALLALHTVAGAS